jgi:hypothetical protein
MVGSSQSEDVCRLYYRYEESNTSRNCVYHLPGKHQYLILTVKLKFADSICTVQHHFMAYCRRGFRLSDFLEQYCKLFWGSPGCSCSIKSGWASWVVDQVRQCQWFARIAKFVLYRKVFGRNHWQDLTSDVISKMSVSALAAQRQQMEDTTFDSD